jgi:hypothetical protein
MSYVEGHALNRYSIPALLLFVTLGSPAIAAPPATVAGAEVVASASERYVATSELELAKVVATMREFMRDRRNMRKAMAIMQASQAYEALTAAGYEAARSSAGEDKELLRALDDYRRYQSHLTHGGLGNADEAEWDGMVAESGRLGELVRAAARRRPGPAGAVATP